MEIVALYLTARLWVARLIWALLVGAGLALAISQCAGCGASVAEYEEVTADCAERASVIVHREGTTLEQDRADLAALREECEAVE
jgi:recombinational DNA repair protein (RecF pathway)